jgi:hypothetical protein
MNLDEVPPLIDVHPPHEPIHGWRDFFIHLSTITIGLLIALGLEGCVEWQHHRHLVHEAQTSLHAEIQNNAKSLPDAIADLHKQQDTLKQDITVLDYIIKNHKAPEHSGLEINFHIRTFDNVSWKTAQATTALSYMSYPEAQEYSDIYETQSALEAAEQQAARDAIISIGPLANTSDGPDPTGGHADEGKQKIQILQGQLLLVDSMLKSLDSEYKKFLSAHPNNT